MLSSIDWGTAPAWFGAIATSGALLITATVFLRQNTDRRTEQARRVSCWPVEETDLRTQTERGLAINPGSGQSVRVTVRNASELPIYDVIAWVRFNYLPDSGASGSQDRVIVPPGDTDVWVDWVEFPEGGLAGDPHVDLTFRDASGKRWQRLHDGSFGPDRMTREGTAQLPPRAQRRWQRSRS